ncbi:hypothetical protein TruAng_001061 [Truncatella angustata]|nr:hypothetical protein TruAng_001061 [Truncatella angustata]
MTAHIYNNLHGSSGVWSSPYGGLSLEELAQSTGSCPPPSGFPAVICHSNGELYKFFQKNTIQLTTHHVSEIEAANANFKLYELDGDEVEREKFPLPTLGPLLERCGQEIHEGHGIVIIRGLDPEKYSIEDSTTIYLGISSYIGDQRGVQSSKGAMLTHVVEKKEWKSVDLYLQPFHNDMGTEILALQVRETAEIGGRTCVAPIRVIYNHLREHNPLVLHTLAKHDWPVRVGTKAYKLCPLLVYHRGNLMITADPARIGPYPGNRAPKLTLEQEMAFAVLQDTARKYQLKLEHQPGDLVYLNNWTLLHAREAYRDGQTSSRHLVRLWLRNSVLGWQVPESVSFPWDCAFGERSKLVPNLSYPLVPLPVYMYSKYNSGTAAFVPTDDEDEDDVNATTRGIHDRDHVDQGDTIPVLSQSGP